MTVINTVKPSMKDTPQNELVNDIDKYHTEAKKFIFKNFKNHPLRHDEDFIADVAHKFMVADYNFDGRGTLEGFRSLLARRTIYQYSRVLKKPKPQSLNKIISLENSEKEIGNLVQDDSEQNNNGFYELIECCPVRYRVLLTRLFVEKATTKEIADEFEVTQNCIYNYVHSALEMIRKNIENE